MRISRCKIAQHSVSLMALSVKICVKLWRRMESRDAETQIHLSLSVSHSNMSLVRDCPAVLIETMFERGEKKDHRTITEGFK